MQDNTIIRLHESLRCFLYWICVCSIAYIVASNEAAQLENTPTNEFTKFNLIYPRFFEDQPSSRHGRVKRQIPVYTTRSQNGQGHMDRVTLVLPFDSKRYLVDLLLNKDLIAEGYFERTQDITQEPIIRKPNYLEAELCHYHGKIRGRPRSWAALSTCDGLRGVVHDGNELHYLEPSIEGRSSSGWKTLHFQDSYRRRRQNLTEEYSHDHAPDVLIPGNYLHQAELNVEPKSRAKRELGSNIHESYNSNEKTRYVEMVLVVDNKKYREMASDLRKVTQRAKDIANIVNALYIPLNVVVALVGVVVWTQKDEIIISSKGDDTLSSFLFYRRERLLKDHPNDNAQLLTAVEFEDGVVGKAMQGPICSYKYSGGVNSDFKSVLGIVATTIAHELGHNFGLSHDDTDKNKKCQCDGPDSKCIMSASSSSNRTAHWSSCSRDSMKYAFDHGMDACLRNKPKRLFESPTCGNGLTEPGEDCDCGLAETCTNPCCNANTCRLHPNATCAAGTCCDVNTCHVKSGGTLCRSAQDTCDLPEFCNGESEFCPEDVFKLNGLKCETSNGLAFCNEGECKTHTDQCKLLWGSTGKTSGDVCYQKNVNGSRYGHCGLDLVTGNYTACAREDIKCGVLQCEHHHEKLEFGYESVALLSSFFVNIGGKIHPCRSVTTDFGLEVRDPGLVPNGAKCGENKMCLNQKCVPVSPITAPFLCPDDCNGNGICNSKGHCHCNEGYGGTSCDTGGYGGSLDSGPIINPHGASSVFARALYVTFLGFIPLVGIISFYLYYANDNFKKICKRGQAVTRVQTRRKPPKNRDPGGLRGTNKDASNSTTIDMNGSNSDGRGTAADDFFGQYKGFSLSPMKIGGSTAESAATATGEPVLFDAAKVVLKSTNNNTNRSSNQNIQCMYTSPPVPVVKQTEILVGNEKPSLKQSFLQKGIARVSWAQPIAISTPISPDDSANNGDDSSSNTSDTPLTTGLALSVKSEKPKLRPLSSPDALNDTKLFDPPLPNTSGRRFPGFGSSSALSRFAAAFPFVRNSIRASSSTEDNATPTLTSTLTRQRSFNRETVEISRPILQNASDAETKVYGNLIPIIQPADHVDDVDSGSEPVRQPHCTNGTPIPETRYRFKNGPSSSSPKQNDSHLYTNIPSEDETGTRLSFGPTSSPLKPVSKTFDRIKSQAPGALPLNSNKHVSKVARAHSMVQPNRNSILASNPNYNSLRRSRPSAPPPKPPDCPPPPVPAPNKPSTLTSLKFSLLGTCANNNPPLPAISFSKNQAPIAKMDDSDIGSPCTASPPSPRVPKPENIYDIIDEGTTEPALMEKVETLSTGSSDGANGTGLLSEIISEISSRNKESIYNSVDRRKKKRLEKEKAKVAQEPILNIPFSSSPKNTRITVNPGFDMKSQLTRTSSPTSPKLIKKIPARSPTPPKEHITSTNNKPTCAVNGIPKVASSPSYVAKINYFSNLSIGKKDAANNLGSTPMKSINSLSQVIITPPVDESDKEPIYAPGQLSTIRRSRPSNKTYLNSVEAPVQSALPKSNGVYGKPVASPQIPTNCIKEAVPVKPIPVTNSCYRSGQEKPIECLSSRKDEQSQIGGYKSFNPYLNRPLSFSTFRPTSTQKSYGESSDVSSSSSHPPTGSSPATCSSVSKPATVSPVNIVGVSLNSPDHLRSPSRLVK